MSLIREDDASNDKLARIVAMQALGLKPAGYVVLYHCDVCEISFDVLSKTRSESARTCDICNTTSWPHGYDELWPDTDEGESK